MMVWVLVSAAFEERGQRVGRSFDSVAVRCVREILHRAGYQGATDHAIAAYLKKIPR
jgi:hypothetical protein